MDAQDAITVGAAVTALTQLTKWAGLPDKWGPLSVLILAAVGVALWAWSQNGDGDFRLAAWEYFVGWINVALSSAGIYGFTRASATVVTQMRPPPGGAGQERTTT